MSLSTPVLLALSSLRPSIKASSSPSRISNLPPGSFLIEKIDVKYLITESTSVDVSLSVVEQSINKSFDCLWSVQQSLIFLNNHQLVNGSQMTIGVDMQELKNIQQGFLIGFDSLEVVFPYSDNPIGQNVFELIKSATIVQSVLDPIQSGRPPRSIKVKIDYFSFSLLDDLFEVKLETIYLFKQRKYGDVVKRRSYLENKISDRGFSKIVADSLRDELTVKESRLWIEGVQKVLSKQKASRDLVSITCRGIELLLGEEEWFSNEEEILNFVKNCDEYDTSCHLQHFLPFNLLLSLHQLSIKLRDFEPILTCELFSITGPLILSDSSTFTEQLVPVSFKMPMTNPPYLLSTASPTFSKIYSNFEITLSDSLLRYSKCWQPVIDLVSNVFDCHTPPSVVSFPPLRPWDKLRLMMVGRPRIRLLRSTLFLGTSLSPWSWRNCLITRWSSLEIDLNIKNPSRFPIIKISFSDFQGISSLSSGSNLGNTPFSVTFPKSDKYSNVPNSLNSPFGASPQPICKSPLVKAREETNKTIFLFSSLTITSTLVPHSFECNQSRIANEWDRNHVDCDCGCRNVYARHIFPILTPNKTAKMDAIMYLYDPNPRDCFIPTSLTRDQNQLLKSHQYRRVDCFSEVMIDGMSFSLNNLNLTCLLKVLKGMTRGYSVYPVKSWKKAIKNDCWPEADLISPNELIRLLSARLTCKNMSINFSKILNISIDSFSTQSCLFNYLFNLKNPKTSIKRVAAWQFESMISEFRNILVNSSRTNSMFDSSLCMLKSLSFNIPLSSSFITQRRLFNSNYFPSNILNFSGSDASPSVFEVPSFRPILSPQQLFSIWRGEERTNISADEICLAIQSPKLKIYELLSLMSNLIPFSLELLTTLNIFSRSQFVVVDYDVPNPLTHLFNQISILIDCPQLALSDTIVLAGSLFSVRIHNLCEIKANCVGFRCLLAPIVAADEGLWAEPDSDLRDITSSVKLFHPLNDPLDVSVWYRIDENSLTCSIPLVNSSVSASDFKTFIHALQCLSESVPTHAIMDLQDFFGSDSKSTSGPNPVSIKFNIDNAEVSLNHDSVLFFKSIVKNIKFHDSLDSSNKKAVDSVLTFEKVQCFSYLESESSSFSKS
ncbi:hypothetical protein GEMRC1_002775 [Eukaryota sp. GEM-RC1]